jgi:hypothetical protein
MNTKYLYSIAGNAISNNVNNDVRPMLYMHSKYHALKNSNAKNRSGDKISSPKHPNKFFIYSISF